MGGVEGAGLGIGDIAVAIMAFAIRGATTLTTHPPTCRRGTWGRTWSRSCTSSSRWGCWGWGGMGRAGWLAWQALCRKQWGVPAACTPAAPTNCPPGGSLRPGCRSSPGQPPHPTPSHHPTPHQAANYDLDAAHVGIVYIDEVSVFSYLFLRACLLVTSTSC